MTVTDLTTMTPPLSQRAYVTQPDQVNRPSSHLLHALCRLARHVDAAHGVELGLEDVQVAVEAAALAPLRDDGEVGLSHEAHEQQDVDMARLSVKVSQGRERQWER